LELGDWYQKKTQHLSARIKPIDYSWGCRSGGSLANPLSCNHSGDLTIYSTTKEILGCHCNHLQYDNLLQFVSSKKTIKVEFVDRFRAERKALHFGH
jgi:hypothetical protein